MPPLVLYKFDSSPPVRAVLMTLDILGLKPKMIEIDLMAGDTLKPEFVAKNPVHTIPFLEDGDFSLSDSHAIITYLVSKYGADKRSELYPNDYNIRATIDQRLYFDASILFPKVRTIFVAIFKEGKNGSEQIPDIEETYGILEKYLEKQFYIANDRLTLADVSILSTLSTLELFVPVTENYPKLLDWITRMKDTEFCKKANMPGLQPIKDALKTMREGQARNAT